MHKLILLVCVTFIYTISLLLASGTKDYYFAFNFCAIPVIISGCFFGEFSTLLIVSYCCILSLTSMLGGVSMANVLQNAFLLTGCALLSIAIKRSFNKFKIVRQNTIKSLKERFTASEFSTSQVNNRKLYFENKVSEISNLYYTVKRMGSCSTFEELLDALRDTITESFKFRRCELITLYESQPMASPPSLEKPFLTRPVKMPDFGGGYRISNEVKIDKVYQITKEGVEQIEGVGYEERLLKFMLRKKQLLVIDSEKGKVDAEEFVFPEQLRSFIAAPIISAEKTNAILVAEDIDLEQTNQFAVATNQFSMALERIRLYELVQELAITDDLTKVFVRRHLMERLNEELVRADLFNTRVSLLMIDIDNFKDYNDRYGHLKGDFLLKKTASVLKAGIREIDIIGRYGGEEFCIVFPDTDSKGAELVANRLRENVKSLNATISIGMATYPNDAKNTFDLIEKADRMLYKAKQAGKDRVCAYTQNRKANI